MNELTGITRVGCLAHLRRKFVEAIPQKKNPDGPPTSAEIGRQYCDKLFAIEDSLKDLSNEERFCKRLELEKPVLEAFWCWLDSLNALKGSALGKAVTYAIRPFTVGRKNWLFADTPKGASAEWQQYPEELDELMPWSPEVQAQCKQ